MCTFLLHARVLIFINVVRKLARTIKEETIGRKRENGNFWNMCISFLSSQKNKHHLQFLFSAQCNTDVVRAYLRPERGDRKR